MPRLCEFFPDICLTTEEKARKNLSQVKENLSHSTVYILSKTPTHYKTLTNTRITNPTHTHTHADTHTTKQYKTTTVSDWSPQYIEYHGGYLKQIISKKTKILDSKLQSLWCSFLKIVHLRYCSVFFNSCLRKTLISFAPHPLLLIDNGVSFVAE